MIDRFSCKKAVFGTNDNYKAPDRHGLINESSPRRSQGRLQLEHIMTSRLKIGGLALKRMGRRRRAIMHLRDLAVFEFKGRAYAAKYIAAINSDGL